MKKIQGLQAPHRATLTWISKKHGSIALSTVEVEYMLVASCCAPLLWIKNQLEDYSVYGNKIPICCYNRVAIILSKNPTLHSKAKHI